MLAAVVDVNLLVSGFISGRAGREAASVSLVDLWLDGRITLVVSPRLLEELEETLRSDKVAQYIPADDVLSYVSLVATTARLEPEPSDPPAVCRDPSDDYLFALAASTSVPLVSADPDVLAVEQPPREVLRIGDFLRRVRVTMEEE